MNSNLDEQPAIQWPAQLMVLHGEDRDDLRGRIGWLLEWLAAQGEPGSHRDEDDLARLCDLAKLLASCVHPGGSRLGIVAANLSELRQRAQRAADKLADLNCTQIRDVGGIYYVDEPLYEEGGQVAFIYPGEGAQYLGMMGDMMVLPEVQECFESASHAIVTEGDGAVAPIEFTVKPDDPEQRDTLNVELKKLDNAMLTVLVADWAMTLVLRNMGVPCMASAGHSAGELAALMMSNGLDHADDLLGPLLHSMSELERSPGVDATLLAVGAHRAATTQLLEEIAAASPDSSAIPAELAMDNCPHQTVIVGLSDVMKTVEEKVQQRGWVYERLELARPYHTALFEPLMAPLREMFQDTNFSQPSPPVYSCTTAELFPNDPDEIRNLCIAHWRCRVEFVAMIRKMYDDGIRIFVEAGPRGNLCSFVEDILRGQPMLAVPANVQRRHGLTQLLHVAAQLFAHGVPLNLEYFFGSAAPAASIHPTSQEFVSLDTESDDIDFELEQESVHHQSVHSDSGENLTVAASNTLSSPAWSTGPTTASGQVMQSYLNVMNDFLQTQEAVMHQYLTGESPTKNAWVSPMRAISPLSLDHPNGDWAQEAEASYGTPDDSIHPTDDHSHGAGSNGRPTAQPSDSPFGRHDDVDPRERPMIGDIIKLEEGESLVMRRVLDLEEDIYADHHTVGGRSLSRVQPSQHGLPIMPLTFTVEMMAEVGQVLLPQMTIRQVKNIQLMRWLAFFDGDPATIEVTAKRLAEDEHDREHNEVRVLIQIRNLGNSASQDTAKYVAAVGTVVMGAAPLEPDCDYSPFDMEGARECNCPLDVLYMNLFHGEMFQAVESLDVMADKGIEGTVYAQPREGLFASNPDPQFLGDPILLDVAMHPPVAWHLAEPDQSGRILLPFELKSLEFFGRRPPAHHRFKARTRIVETTIRHFAHLTEVFDVDTGKIWARINQVKLWRFYLPFRDVNFHGPKDIYFISTEWPEVVPEAVADQVSCVQMLPLEDLKGPALLGAAARVLMSPAEFDRFERLDRPMDKKPQFLFGRIVAKDAVRYFQRTHHDQRVFMADVEIDVNEQGRPIASPRGEVRPDDYPTISISHCDGMICAIAARHPWVGIDIEPVERREASFERIAFSSTERALLDSHSNAETRPEMVARFWCAKEAVSKALGEGLVEGPQSLTVAEIAADGRVLVSLGPTLAAEFPEFADELLIAWTQRDDQFVVATSLCWRHSEVPS